MSEPFDPYYVWLGIPPEEQPPHHYRLLGLRTLEGNADVISNAVDQRRTHLRTFQAGKRGVLSQKLLNEVSAAGVCLLDAARKQKYDVELRQKLGGNAGASGIGSAAMPPMPVARVPEPSASALAGEPASGWASPSGISVAASPKKEVPRPSGTPALTLLLLGGGCVALLALVLVGVAAWRLIGSDPQVAVKPPKRPQTPVSPGPVEPGPVEPGPVEPVRPMDDDPPGPITTPPPSVPVVPSVPTAGGSGLPAAAKQIWLAAEPEKRVLRHFGGIWVEFREGEERWFQRIGAPPDRVSLIDMVTRRGLAIHDDHLETFHPTQAQAIVAQGRWISDAELPAFAKRAKSAQRPEPTYRDASWDALVFDGEVKVEIPVPQELTQPGAEFTVEMWLRLEPDSKLAQVLDSSALALASDPTRRMPGRPGLPLVMRAGATTVTMHPALEARKWHHLAMVREGRMLRFFYDGRTSSAMPVDENYALAGPHLVLGRASPAKPGLRGLVRDLRISSGARYKNTFTPPLKFAKDDQTLVLPRFRGEKTPTIEDLSGRGHAVGRGSAEWIPLTADGMVMAESPGTHVDLERAFAASRNTLRGDTLQTSEWAESQNATGVAQTAVPYAPPPDYDLDLEVTRKEGGGGALVGLLVGSGEQQKQIAVAIGAFPSADGSSRIGVLPADLSQLDDALVPSGFQIRADQPQRIKLEVRQPAPDSFSVRVNVDGRPVYTTQQSLASAGLPSTLAMPHRASLFWGSQDAALRYTEMKLIPMRGTLPASDYLVQATRFTDPPGSASPGSIASRPFPGVPVVTNPPIPAVPAVATPATSKARKPVPSAEALAAKVKEARDLYQDEFKKATKAEQKAALGRSIQTAGEGTTSDQTARYVLLDLARKVFIQAGEVSSSLRAARNLEGEYDIPAAELIDETLKGLNDALLDPANRAQLAREAADLADELLGIGEFDRADSLSAVAVQSANKQKDAELKKQMAGRRAQISRIVKEHTAIKPHLATLTATADDAAANLAVGKFYALTLEDWPQAVPHLIKSKDGVFSAAAELDEKAKAGAAADQLAAAEAWLTLADGTKVSEKDDKLALQRHGKQWIESAIGSLTGLDRLKAEKRLEKLRDLPPGRTKSTPSFAEESASPAATPSRGPRPRSSRASPTIVVNGQRVLPPQRGEFDAVHVVSGSVGGGGGNLIEGWEFKVKADVEITHLGLFDSRADGLESVHEVAIWDLEDPTTPVVLESIPNGVSAPLAGLFRMAAVTPVQLKADRQYAIVAHYRDASDGTVSLTNPQGLTIQYSQHVEAAGRRYAFPHMKMAFPDSATAGAEHPAIGPTFRYKLATP